MKEFDEAKRRISKISPSGNLQTNLVDAMNSLLELCGALMKSQIGSTLDIGKAHQEGPSNIIKSVENLKPSIPYADGTIKEDPRKSSSLKPEEKSKVSDLIDSISKVKK